MEINMEITKEESRNLNVYAIALAFALAKLTKVSTDKLVETAFKEIDNRKELDVFIKYVLDRN